MQNEHSDFGHTNTNEANSITENVEQLPRVLEYNNSGLAGNQSESHYLTTCSNLFGYLNIYRK